MNFRVKRTFLLTTLGVAPTRFSCATAEYETRSEAEVAYARACILAGTWRVCLDERSASGWELVASFPARRPPGAS